MTLPARKVAKKATATLNVLDDGTASISLNFTDVDGLPITGLTAYPSQLAQPTFASSDQTPGPSAFLITPSALPSSNAVTGGLTVASVSCVAPVVQPPAANVDFTVTIASGFTNQTAPLVMDAGDLSIVADPSALGGFAAVTSTP
jgi:hypothetical protein